jgi:CheY-like chemotaxis protein
VPVLVVEDDPADCLAIQRLLAGSIYQPLVARSVRDARRFMQSVRPEAILLDVMLVGDESWRLLLELRGQDTQNDIPVIVTSSTGEVRKAVHLGADDYMAKPVDRERLIDALDRVTGRHSIIRVLLVDDEEVTHYLVRQLLPRSQYRVWIARDGRDALDHLPEYRPDVILLDLAMPGMNGFAFLNCFRQDISSAELPVIVLTSSILDPQERSSLDSTSMILSKSELASDTLINAIGSVLRSEADVGAG